MKIKAYAKINLCLDVESKRDDGYHNLNMIMSPISLYDEIEITKTDKDHHEFECINGSMEFDETNTIVRALTIMTKEYCIQDKFSIKLTKHIPMQAGLAGGSSDAAAIIQAISKMYQLPITSSKQIEIGKQIGADVPFCLFQSCAIVQGIGEKLHFFSYDKSLYLLLIKPKEGVSTKDAFQQLDLKKCDHPDVKACKRALEKGDLSSFYASAKNSLEQSAFQMVNEIKKIKEELLALGLPMVLMSGSGSCVFAISENQAEITQAYEQMKGQYDFVYQGCCLK